MKKLILIIFLLLPIVGMAKDSKKAKNTDTTEATKADNKAPQGEMKASPKQVSAYTTFIYTDSDLGDEIQIKNDDFRSYVLEDEERGIWSDLATAALNAAEGIGTGYISSAVELGINAIAALVTRNSKLKEEWMTTVKAENSWSKEISTVEEIKDFYRMPSYSGALDPIGMQFNGIGCLRMEGRDTAFYISCHIDRDKLYRIARHSKFELVLDTLIISPTRSNLPNTQLDSIKFSFHDRENFNLGMNIKLTSSWFTDAIELHQDEQLGEFSLNVAITENMLDKDGVFRYVRKDGETSAYEISGESFIVPRSFMGFRKDGAYHNIWGTGQYKVSITLSETCGISKEYSDNWKEDRKFRKSLQPKESVFNTVWKTISTQKWDEATQSWIVTLLSAPANLAIEDLNNYLGVTATATAGMGGDMTSGTGNMPMPQ